MKNLCFLFLFLSAISICHAQQAPVKSAQTPEEKADEIVAKLTNELSLTGEQIPKVKAITIDRINKVTAAHKKNGPDKQRLQAANKLIFDEWETQLKGILTADQYSNYLSGKGQK
ncbi:MAG TPA: hypothetical protein VK766_01900 [Cytophagaceae bacterium]|jgi:protein CpxP|nr:hypothetical protein [Cytophagaceae bacterium]